ncbi:MAG: SufD family Fe-S cluster assembly protein [Pseudomonadota bacterium]
MAATIEDLRAKLKNPNPAELELMAQYASLPEDGRRARIFEAFALSGLPHRRLESWKWSDFRAALSELRPASSSGSTALLKADDAPLIAFRGKETLLPGGLPDGISLHQVGHSQAFGDAEEAPLGALAAALGRRSATLDTLIVEVTGKPDRPLHIEVDGCGAETQFARVAIVVRPGAELDLIESHIGGAGFSSVLLEIGMQAGGAVRRTVLQRGGKDEAQALTSLIHLGDESDYTQTMLAFGAQVARIETRLVHQKPQSKATLNAAYLCGDGYHADFTSHVRHGATHCVTRQTTKGAVLNGGKGVFQGKFLVPRDIGQHTDADMQHQALLLEPGAEVFAKPELEIYADDVECAHGNTSGALDPDQIFYLRQRGLPLNQARAMLTQAFVSEALECADESVKAFLLGAAREFLSEVPE